jgi:hypothetical protein
MTDEEYQRVAPVIEMAQRLEGKLHDQLIARGVVPIDALIAATYSAHALATKLHGNPVAAVEWMRDVLDTIERQLLTPGESH